VVTKVWNTNRPPEKNMILVIWGVPKIGVPWGTPNHTKLDHVSIETNGFRVPPF
jgi:hypothetical protein